MFQSYLGISYPAPDVTAQYNYYITTDEYQLYLENLIKKQYIEFIQLGVNTIENDIVGDGVFERLIDYVDQNYLSIMNINILSDNQQYVQFFGRIIYEFIVIDMFKYILPDIIQTNSIKATDLLVYDVITIKNMILRSIKEKLNILRSIDQKVSSIDVIKKEMIKYTYYIDLIDNNLDNFLVNYIQPVINKYEALL